MLDSPEHRDLFARLHGASGVDFEAYRPAMVARRIEHRMRISRASSLTEYAALLGRDPLELARLLDALLIKTTAMFRGEQAFAALRDRVLPGLLARRAAEGATCVRAWVAGCSTGEEAYSLAMCLLEARDRAAPQLGVEVLASDVDARALELAASGVVSASQAARVPEALSTRWLREDGEGYRATEELRSHLVFVRHDVLDPASRAPRRAVFASFDVVSCRNLIIHLQRQPQLEVVGRLARACEEGSVLFLGSAETLPEPLLREFVPLAPSASLYARR
ncbi:MAG: protein-glutamate O-methyltransferase CheR [Byssovorax sp.]